MKTQDILQQIDSALEEWRAFSTGAFRDDCSDRPEEDAVKVTTRLASTIKRFAPSNSMYVESLDKVLETKGHSYIYQKPLVGILTALRSEYELGYFARVEELIHAETFSDFLDMAQHLLSNGYKDAAAVIAGSTLEQHLRELCNRNGLQVTSNGKPKKADTMNSELAGSSVYSKLDQKNVTSWLGLRNNAAHGNYASYTTDQVQLLIDATRNFFARHPA